MISLSVATTWSGSGFASPSGTGAFHFEYLIVLTHQYCSYQAVLMGDKVTAVRQIGMDFHQLFLLT